MSKKTYILYEIAKFVFTMLVSVFSSIGFYAVMDDDFKADYCETFSLDPKDETILIKKDENI